MQTLTLPRICELDVACVPVRDCFESIPFGNVDHKDNKKVFMEIAKNLGITLEEFSSYVWLQAYVRELSESFEDLPTAKDVAKQFDINPADFEQYLGNRAETLRAEYTAKYGGFSSEEVAELRARGFSFTEWKEYIDDICEDAGRQGD